MRPQLLPADAAARLNLQPPARPTNRSEASLSTDGFKAVLKRIRSARSESREQPPPSKPGNKQEPVSDDRPADETQVPVSGEVVPSDGARPDDNQAAPPEQPRDEASDSAPESVEPQAQQTDGGLGEVKPETRPGAIPSSVLGLPEMAEPAVIPTRPPQDASERVLDEPQRVPRLRIPVEPTPVPEGSDDLATLPKPAAQPVLANNQDTTEDDADAAASSEQGPQNRPVKAQRADGAVPVDRSADSLKKLAENGPRFVAGEQQTTREGLRDLQQDLAIQARKIAIAESGLDSELKGAEPSRSGAADGRQVRAGSEAPHVSVGKGVQSAPASVGSAVGDPAAASVAAFMLSSPPTDGNAGGQAATVFTATAAQSGAAASGGPAAPGVSASIQGGDASATLSSVVAEGPLSLADGAKVLAASNSGSRHEVTLRLEPPEMGQLKVQIRMQHQAMTMQVDADSPTVARLIESRLSDLRDALALHGIKMDRTDVVIRSPAPSDTNTQQHNQQQGGAADQGRATGDESTGWQGQDSQTADSQDQSSSWQFGGEGVADSDGNAGTILAEEALAGVGLDATTELSLDLVA